MATLMLRGYDYIHIYIYFGAGEICGHKDAHNVQSLRRKLISK